MVVLNNPYLGGTHLPDVTLIAPLFAGTAAVASKGLIAFLVNRAHHADIGASSPGCMPLSRTLAQKGLIIAPTRLIRDAVVQTAVLDRIVGATRNPAHARGDFFAQISANRAGLARLGALVRSQQTGIRSRVRCAVSVVNCASTAPRRI